MACLCFNFIMELGIVEFIFDRNDNVYDADGAECRCHGVNYLTGTPATMAARVTMIMTTLSTTRRQPANQILGFRVISSSPSSTKITAFPQTKRLPMSFIARGTLSSPT